MILRPEYCLKSVKENNKCKSEKQKTENKLNIQKKTSTELNVSCKANIKTE